MFKVIAKTGQNSKTPQVNKIKNKVINKVIKSFSSFIFYFLFFWKVFFTKVFNLSISGFGGFSKKSYKVPGNFFNNYFTKFSAVLQRFYVLGKKEGVFKAKRLSHLMGRQKKQIKKVSKGRIVVGIDKYRKKRNITEQRKYVPLMRSYVAFNRRSVQFLFNSRRFNGTFKKKKNKKIWLKAIEDQAFLGHSVKKNLIYKRSQSKTPDYFAEVSGVRSAFTKLVSNSSTRTRLRRKSAEGVVAWGLSQKPCSKVVHSEGLLYNKNYPRSKFLYKKLKNKIKKRYVGDDTVPSDISNHISWKYTKGKLRTSLGDPAARRRGSLNSVAIAITAGALVACACPASLWQVLNQQVPHLSRYPLKKNSSVAYRFWSDLFKFKSLGDIWSLRKKTSARIKKEKFKVFRKSSPMSFGKQLVLWRQNFRSRFKYLFLRFFSKFFKKKRPTPFLDFFQRRPRKLKALPKVLRNLGRFMQKDLYPTFTNKSWKNLRKRAVRKKQTKVTTSYLHFFFYLESRIDFLLFRLGVAPSIKSVREEVRVGDFLVNGSRTWSYKRRVKVGDNLSLDYVYLLRKLDTIVNNFRNKSDAPSVRVVVWKFKRLRKMFYWLLKKKQNKKIKKLAYRLLKLRRNLPSSFKKNNKKTYTKFPNLGYLSIFYNKVRENRLPRELQLKFKTIPKLLTFSRRRQLILAFRNIPSEQLRAKSSLHNIFFRLKNRSKLGNKESLSFFSGVARRSRAKVVRRGRRNLFSYSLRNNTSWVEFDSGSQTFSLVYMPGISRIRFKVPKYSMNKVKVLRKKTTSLLIFKVSADFAYKE